MFAFLPRAKAAWDSCSRSVEEIKKHIKEYNMEVDCKLEESNLYNEEERINNPGIWMNNLKLNMNAEVIWIQFVLDENDKPVEEHTTHIII